MEIQMADFSTRTRSLLLTSVLLACTSGRADAEDALDITQIEVAPGGRGGVMQRGDDNSAAIRQRAVDSGFNSALISQTGEDNIAGISQEGAGNKGEITQNGSNNQGMIIQGFGGNASVQQSGNGLTVTVEQFWSGAPGSAPITVKQAN
jgi:curlin associated repeat protein